MFVVAVVQSANAHLHPSQPGRQHSRHTRALATEAAGHHHQAASSVIHVQPTEVAPQLPPPPVVRAGRTALVPRLGQMMGAAAPQYSGNKLPAVVAAAAPRGAVSVYAAAAGGSSGQLRNGSATTSEAEQQEQRDPFVIHLPATGGTLPCAATDPATAGLPGTPTGSMVAVDAHGLALWQSAPAGSQAGSALSCQGSSSSSSKALAAMCMESPRSALQHKPAAGPLGLLSWSSRDSTWWVGGPIGGTLCVNPPLPPSGDADNGTEMSAALQAALPSALQRRAAAGAPARSANPLAILPVLQQHGKGGSLQHWGSPIGGTLYINPQAPLDWPEGSTWGSGSRSGSGGGGSGAGRRAGGPPAPPSAAAAAAAAAAGRAGSGAGVPPGLGIARAGVALMAAVAAAALATYGSQDKQPPRAVPTTISVTTTAAPAAAAGLGGGVLARASSGSTAAAGAEEGADPAGGPLYHEWMEARLSSALAGFEAEQAMLRTELAVLAAHPAGRGASGSGQGLWRALSGLFAGDSSSSVAPADAVAPGAAGDAALSAGDVSAREAELREQLESLATLRAALSAELAEQQVMLQRARQHERQQVAAATSSSR